METAKTSKLALPFLALVLVHLLSGLQMEQPLIMADELGYLGNARYLSGAGHLPNLEGTQFYHFGYSLLLLPAFWLFSEPLTIYKAVIFINALLAASLYFPLYFVLVSFSETPRSSARWIAFACCLYPSLVLYSSFAWAENAFVLFYVLTIALFGKYLASRSTRDALVFALAAGFLYTLHPRALPVLAAVVVYLLALTLLRAIPPRQLALSASTIGTVFVLTRIVNQHLKAMGWAGEGEVSAAKLAARLLPGSDFPALIERAAGQLLYSTLATQGLFVLGVFAMLWLVFGNASSRSLREVLERPGTGVPVFALITAAGVFAAACTLKLYGLHGPYGLRGAAFIHGRYNEAFALLAAAFALAELSRSGIDIRQLVRRVIVAAAVILCLTVVVMIEIDDSLERQAAETPGAQPSEIIPPSAVDAIAVPGIYPLVEMVGGLNLFFISSIVMASFLIIVSTLRVSWRAGLSLLMLVFCLVSYFNHRHYLLPLVNGARPRLAFATRVRDLGPIASIAYDTALRQGSFFSGLQYLLPDTVFDRFDSRKGEEPSSEVVISRETWGSADRLGARFVVASGRGGALWVLPGETQSRLPFPAYEGVTLGARRRLEVRESGFHGPESFGGAPGRWTHGAATLRLPLDARNPPRMLEIETMVPGRDGARLQVLANGVELWHRRIPRAPWSKTLSLEGVPLGDELLLELKSDTFSPADSSPGSSDTRSLGIVVRGIRLSAREPGITPRIQADEAAQ